MTDLIACLSLGKGTWEEVLKLAESKDFENIYLVTNALVKDKIPESRMERLENIKLIIVNPNDDVEKMAHAIHENLHQRIKGLEVALNLNSGIGKEHMAIISAALKLGVGIRLVTWKEGTREI